jgi:hypothetical protein
MDHPAVGHTRRGRDVKTLTQMSKEILAQRSPSPRPSPPGRGRTVRRALTLRGLQLQSPLLFHSWEKRSDKWTRPDRPKTANGSPSPGGEGRGEGERHTIFVTITDQQRVGSGDQRSEVYSHSTHD